MNVSTKEQNDGNGTNYSVPCTRMKFGVKTFCVAGPVGWNSLPAAVHHAQSSDQFPGMTSYTQYMIDNCVFSDTCSEIHTPHMPVPKRYTSQHMEQQDVAVLD